MPDQNCEEKKKRVWHNPVTGKDYPVAELPTLKNITGIWKKRKKEVSTLPT